ncbi:hypothetical protein JHK87_004290 [Glycine soja]|nr:hypothetical protein JHK87_004290 [Glycine soja]
MGKMGSSVRQRRNPKDSLELSSVQELLDKINSNCDPVDSECNDDDNLKEKIAEVITLWF